jgi:ABC-2 type transport system ATP-binding protein
MSAEPTCVLELDGLCKRYPGFALADVSFALPRGYIMGLIGPNGAGKTTTLKLILGLLRRDGGVIRAFGRASRSARGSASSTTSPSSSGT